MLQTARQQSDQIGKVYAGRNGIIVRAQQLGPEDPDLFGFLALGQIMDSPRSWSRSVACAIGDADNDWLECGSLKNTSQLMLSTRNADFNGIVGMSATNVCNQGHFRRHMLTASFTARDPFRKFWRQLPA